MFNKAKQAIKDVLFVAAVVLAGPALFGMLVVVRNGGI